MGAIPPRSQVIHSPPHSLQTVQLVQDESGHWQLWRQGQAFEIRGAGGYEHLEQLRAHGGNAVRTWDIKQLEGTMDGETLMDRASRLGLAVMVGIWVDQPRRGADYGDQEFLHEQRERVRWSVRQYRDHPALLLWGLGNEVEEPGNDPRVWREMEILAQIVKEEDPDHLVCTVVAGVGDNKIARMMEHYTSLDILGINSYAGAETVPAAVVEQGWTGPYLLTEFGPTGHWEVKSTDWGAPLEPSPLTKAESYGASHRAQYASPSGQCIGTFCFLWGHKQETTSTWFGMFLSTGEKTPSVDAMSRIWTGREPAERAPCVYDLQSDLAAATAAPATIWTVTAETINPDETGLEFEWQVVAETNDRGSGGDFETTPPTIDGCVLQNRGHEARIRTPWTPGAYRVFVWVRNGRGGGASSNFPFRVESA